MRDFSDPAVEQAFQAFPEEARVKLLKLRALILSLEHSGPDLGDITECLKWGEPSYLTKHGSTVRLGWKAKANQYAVYFHCQTKLIDTFKELYGEALLFEGNRAILLPLDKALPEEVLTSCISMSLRYHKLKHLPLLGA